VLSPIIAGLLPLGVNARVAALVMREDRWAAGADLMRAGNPSGWARLDADARFVGDNRQAIEACRAAAQRTGKLQHCGLTIAPPPASK
jgi:hypothetical protein